MGQASEPVEKTVHRGCVRFDDKRYRHVALDQYENQPVLVTSDESDEGEWVWVGDLNGDLICTAMLEELTPIRSNEIFEVSAAKRAEAQLARIEAKANRIRLATKPRPTLLKRLKRYAQRTLRKLAGC